MAEAMQVIGMFRIHAILAERKVRMVDIIKTSLLNSIDQVRHLKIHLDLVMVVT